MKTPNWQEACVLGLGLPLLPCCDLPDLPCSAKLTLCCGLEWGSPCTAAAPQCTAWGVSHSPHLCFVGCKDPSRYFSCKNMLYIMWVLWEQIPFSPPVEWRGHHKSLPLIWLALPKLFLRSSMISVQTYVPLLAVPSSLGESTALPASWGVCFRACHTLAGTKSWSWNRFWNGELSPEKNNVTFLVCFGAEGSLIWEPSSGASIKRRRAALTAFISKAISRVGTLERHRQRTRIPDNTASEQPPKSTEPCFSRLPTALTVVLPSALPVLIYSSSEVLGASFPANISCAPRFPSSSYKLHKIMFPHRMLHSTLQALRLVLLLGFLEGSSGLSRWHEVLLEQMAE